MASAGDSFDSVSAPDQDSSAANGEALQAGDSLAVQRRQLYQRFVEVVEQDGRYPLDAYRFLQEGLEFTVRRAHGETADHMVAGPAGEPDPRHVDGGQLCLGLRDLALARWGRMAKLVLNSWGVHCTGDFGEMVFLMVSNQFLRKTEQDLREHFDGVFNFSELDALYEVPRQPLVEPEFDYSGVAAPGMAGQQI
jgi:uncharacterized repeat protein (TIGR04138 family)